MNLIQEINNDIIKITMRISENFPELSKFIGEMPITIPDSDDPEITIKNLSEYKESLELLLKKYEKHHTDDDNNFF